MTDRRLRLAAAVYLAIQGFQEYVYRTLPDDASAAHPLHIVRSTLMIASMFGLIFVYAVICLQRAASPFAVNVLRNLTRQLTVYAGVSLFPSPAYESVLRAARGLVDQARSSYIGGVTAGCLTHG
jgi:uncharacterized membrane protein